ncbi:MAG: creatininase family protein [Bacteroidia bacterium]|nr:MAG: creatininase family protein [Bacteroidia bacterium]
MKLKHAIFALSFLGIFSLPLLSQKSDSDELPYLWNELSAPDFVKAVELSDGICLLPAGIIEKHGPHLPLSTDLILSREIASRAAELEYALVYPEFYFGQIYEAKHQPGTVAYSPELVWKMLEETCEEMSRNGIKKIIIVNGHGGNNNLFAYFCQAQLAKRKDYVVVFFQPDDKQLDAEVTKLRTTDYGGHADEEETSMLYTIRPDLVHTDQATSQSGRDQLRLNIPYGYTGIWWYASFPNHYAGDGSSPNKTIGEMIFKSRAEQLAELVKFLKTDDSASKLQKQFYQQTDNPLETEQ